MFNRLFFRKNPWRTVYFIITFALFIFVIISGFITFFWPSAHFFIQFNVLFHTGAGLLVGLLMSYFYIGHWLAHPESKTRRRFAKSYRWIGHAAGIFIISSFITGLLMIFTGVTGKVVWIYWGHIIVSVTGCVALGHHLFIALQKQRAKRTAVPPRPAGHHPANDLATLWEAQCNKGILLAVCGRLGIPYNQLPGAEKKDKLIALVEYLAAHHLTAAFIREGERLYPDLTWQLATTRPPTPAAKAAKKVTPLPIKRGLPRATLLTGGLLLLALGLGLTYRHSVSATVELPTYSYPYGSSPFAPSQPTTPDMTFINEEVMANSESCGQSNCHTDIYDQWAESAHRYSTDNPWFEQALLEMVATEGPNATRYCGGCHDPLALLSGKMDAAGPVRNSHPDEGISCIACHSITQINDLTGTSAYEVTPPEQYLFWERKGAVAQYLNYLLIRLKPGPHGDTFMQPFYQEPVYCGLCHKQFIDERTNDYRWLRLQDQYDDWQQSGFSHEAVMVWYPEAEAQSCNDCHMQNVASYDLGGQVEEVMSHRYIAANTAIPFFYGHETQLAETVTWLEREEIAVDIFAQLSPDRQTVMTPLDRANQPLLPGESYLFDVAVTNHIAHGFPTGPLDLYEAWLEFQVVDGRNTVIYSSGLVDEKGVLDQTAHQFIAPPINGAGDWIRKHDLWNEYTVAFNNSIPAQETQVVHYEVTIPATAVPPFTVTGRVRYRRFNRWYTEWAVAPDAPRFPIVDLSSNTVQIGPAGLVGETRVEDYLRYNQYGIGLFRQELYAEAIAAFTQAVTLNPAYADGYINVGLVYLQTGDLAQAEAWFRQALTIAPDSGRGQAYLGITWQRQGHLPEAISLLSAVAARYPRDTKVLFALGKSYYLAGQHELAAAALQQSLAIDPDQAAVHELLAPCYEGMGQHDEAAAAQEQFLRLQKLSVAEGRAAFFEAHEWARPEASLYHTH